jgi:PEGA domain
MKRCGWFLGAGLCAAAMAGCVERRYVIYTDPPGAVVYRNGQILGYEPVDDYFIYYGKYDFTLVKEGYEIQQVQQEIKAPWYEFPGLDFISENIIPWRIIDRRVFNYQLQPRRVANQQELLNEAQNLRNRGLGLGAGSALPQSAAPQTVPAPAVSNPVPPVPQAGSAPALPGPLPAAPQTGSLAPQTGPLTAPSSPLPQH